MAQELAGEKLIERSIYIYYEMININIKNKRYKAKFGNIIN